MRRDFAIRQVSAYVWVVVVDDDDGVHVSFVVSRADFDTLDVGALLVVSEFDTIVVFCCHGCGCCCCCFIHVLVVLVSRADFNTLDSGALLFGYI